MERLDAARLVYEQVLGERPPEVRAERPLLLASAEGAPPAAPRAAPADAAEARRRVEAWLGRMEAAADELVTADTQRQTLVDAFVAMPEEGVQRLMEVARSFGRVPVHPLLRPEDLPVAARVFRALTERPEPVAALRRAAAAPAPAPELRRVGEAVYREITELAPPLPKALAPLPLSHAQQQMARGFTTRIAAAAPRVLEAVDRTRREMADARTVAERDAARDVGAQVLYAEMVGKEALLEAQKVFSPRSRVVDVALTPRGLERRLVMGRTADLVRLEPVPTIPKQTVAGWRKSLRTAKVDLADARLGLERVKYAAPVERLRLDRAALGRELQATLDQVERAPPTTPDLRARIQVARTLPDTRELQQRLRVAVREAERAPRAPGAADVIRYAKQALPEVDREVRVAEQTAATISLLEPRARAAITEWKQADKGYLVERVKLADDGKARAQELQLAKTGRADFTRELQRMTLEKLPPPDAVSRDLSPRLAAGAAFDKRLGAGLKTPAPPLARAPASPTPAAPERKVPWDQVTQMLESGEKQWQGRAQYLRANYNMTFDPGRLDREKKAHDAQVAWAINQVVGPGSTLAIDELRQEAQRRAPAQRTAYGAVYTREQLEDPAFLQQLYRSRLGGWGAVHQFKDADEYKAFVQSRLGGYGIVHTRQDLQNPDYLEKLLRQRIGQYGWVHRFKDEDEYAKFVQSRLGGWGVVHKRSDLQDPDYLLRLYRQRLGGWGWVHKFKDEDELRNFVQSRLGGLGRAYNCNDLARLGWKPDQIKAIFENAKKYGKKPFETDAQYRERMLREHPGEFTVDEHGKFRRKTQAEKDATRREELLASGDWIEDPRTGTLVPKGSKRGRTLVEEERRRTTTRVEIPLADGRRVSVDVQGAQSFYDVLGDALRARGLQRNAAGDWVDAAGRVVLDGDKYLAFDRRYVDEKSKTDPDFATNVAYRSPPERIPTPPPTPAQELAGLQRDLKSSIGFTARGLKVDGRELDIEVKPGQSVPDAVAERLRAEGRDVAYDDFGNLKDRKTGRVVVPRERVEGWLESFDRKLSDSIFGQGNTGFTQDTLWLAEHGSPAQRARAQQIIQQTTARLTALRDTQQRQAELQAQLAALGDRSRLRAADRAKHDALRRELDAATARRGELETAVLTQTRTANQSAGRVVDRSLSYDEREAVQARERAAGAAREIAEVDRRIAAATAGSTNERNLKRLRASLVEDLLRAERKAGEHVASLESDGRDTARVAALAPPVDRAALRVGDGTVLSRREAVTQARGVVLVEEDGRTAAYAGDGRGGRLVDTAGRPIRLSQGERSQVDQRLRREAAEAERRRKAEERAAVSALLAQEKLATAADRRYQEIQQQIDNYTKTLDSVADTPANTARRAALERRRAELIARQAASGEVLTSYARQFGALSEEGRKQYEQRSAELAAERARREQEYLEAEYAVEYVNDKGETVRLLSSRQQAYQAEQRRLKEEAERRAREAREREAARRAEATARREAEEARRAAQAEREAREAARREAEQREAARRATESRLLQGSADAEGRRRRADEQLASARTALEAPGGNTATNRAAYERAQKELAEARQAEQTARLAAMAVPTDPRFLGTLEAQRAGIDSRREALETIQATKDAAKRDWDAAVARMAEGRATAADVTRAREAYEARLRESERAYQALQTAQRTYAQLVDVGQYALASPDANRARLSEFEQRERENRAAGRFAYAGFSDEERQEYSRRLNLSWYHDKVAKATESAEEIRRLAERRDRGETLTAEELRRLERGPTLRELTVLLGEQQRRERLAGLAGQSDLDTKARELAILEQWMTSTEGALGGRDITREDEEFARARGHYLTGTRIPRTLSEWDAARAAQVEAETARRAAEAERHQTTVVDPALARNREVDSRLAAFDRQAVEDRRQREDNLRATREDIAALERRIARTREMSGQGLREETAQRRIQSAEQQLRTLRETLHRDTVRYMAPERREEQTRRLEQTVAQQERQIQAIELRIARREIPKDQGEAQIKNIREARDRNAADLGLYRTLPSPELGDRSRRAAIEAERVPEFRYDAATRALEEAARNQRALAASRQRALLEQELASARAAADARVKTARAAVERKEQDLRDRGYLVDAGLLNLNVRAPAEDRAELERLRQTLRDTEAGRDTSVGVRARQLAQAEREEREEFERNRRDRLGPIDTYDVGKAADAAGIDWRLHTQADADRLRAVSELAERIVGISERERVTAEGPSLLAATLQEVQWSNLTDPVWLAKTTLNAEYGAARATGRFATDLVTGVAKLGAAGTTFLARAVASHFSDAQADKLGADLLKAYETARRLGKNPDVIVRALGEAAKLKLAGLTDRNGRPNEARIAEFAGDVTMSLYLNLVLFGPKGDPQAGFSAGQRVLAEAAAAAERARKAEALGLRLAEPGRLARFVRGQVEASPTVGLARGASDLARRGGALGLDTLTALRSDPRGALSSAAGLVRDSAMAAPGVVAGLARADLVETAGRARAGYGLLDDAGEVARAASQIRREALVRAAERISAGAETRRASQLARATEAAPTPTPRVTEPAAPPPATGAPAAPPPARLPAEPTPPRVAAPAPAPDAPRAPPPPLRPPARPTGEPTPPRLAPPSRPAPPALSPAPRPTAAPAAAAPVPSRAAAPSRPSPALDFETPAPGRTRPTPPPVVARPVTPEAPRVPPVERPTGVRPGLEDAPTALTPRPARETPPPVAERPATPSPRATPEDLSPPKGVSRPRAGSGSATQITPRPGQPARAAAAPAERAPDALAAPPARPRRPEDVAAVRPAAPEPLRPSPAAAPDAPRAPPRGAPGAPDRPLDGEQILVRYFDLEGHTIRLGPTAAGADPGPITLGRRVGSEGAFGIVYEVEGQPGRLVKILHNEEAGPASVARQVSGYSLIKDAPDIPAPRILGHRRGSDGDPGFLIVEDLRAGRWADKNVRFRGSSRDMTPEELRAAQELYDALGQRGLFWADGHANNLFFFDEGGRVRAGVIDHDMIFRASDLARQDAVVQGNLLKALGPDGLRRFQDVLDGAPGDAQAMMRTAFERRFGTAFRGAETLADGPTTALREATTLRGSSAPPASAARAPAGLPSTAPHPPPPGASTAPWTPGQAVPALSPVVAPLARAPPTPAQRATRGALDDLVAAQGRARDRNLGDAERAAARQAVDAQAGKLVGQRLTRPDGTSPDGVDDVTVGARLGGGTFGQVFDAQGQPDKVVKLFANPDIPKARLAEAIEGQRSGARLLADPPTGQSPIATKKILGGDPDPDAPVPYLVMEKLRGDAKAREDFGAGRRAPGDLPKETVEYQVDAAARRAAGAPSLHPEEQGAVLELYKRLADQNLVWQDGHLGNVYFFKNAQGKLEAGILDTDRIVRPGVQHGIVAELREAFATRPGKFRIRSLTGLDAGARQDLLRDPAAFMQAMLEHHRFIGYDPKSGAFRPGSIDPRLVEQYFPGVAGPRAARAGDTGSDAGRAGSAAFAVTRPEPGPGRGAASALPTTRPEPAPGGAARVPPGDGSPPVAPPPPPGSSGFGSGSSSRVPTEILSRRDLPPRGTALVPEDEMRAFLSRPPTQRLDESEILRPPTRLLRESELPGRRPGTRPLRESEILPRRRTQPLSEGQILPGRPDAASAPVSPVPIPATPRPGAAAPVPPPAASAPAAAAPARGPPAPLAALRPRLEDLREQFRRGTTYLARLERDVASARGEVVGAGRLLADATKTGDAGLIQRARGEVGAARTRLAQVEQDLAGARQGFEQVVDSRIKGLQIALPAGPGVPATATLKTPYGAGRYGFVSQIEEDPSKVVKLGVNPRMVDEWEAELVGQIARGERSPMSPLQIRDEAVANARWEMREAFRGQVAGARHLDSPPRAAGDRVPYKRLHGGRTDGDPPFLIMDRLQTEPVTRPDGTTYREYPLSGKLDGDEQDAVLGVYQNLARQRLGWADGHLDNLYGIEAGGKKGAGILDTDRLGRIDGPELEPWKRQIAENPVANRVLSLEDPARATSAAERRAMIARNRARLDDPEVFAAKMLEYKGYLAYDRASGRWVELKIDPARAARFLPLRAD